MSEFSESTMRKQKMFSICECSLTAESLVANEKMRVRFPSFASRFNTDNSIAFLNWLKKVITIDLLSLLIQIDPTIKTLRESEQYPYSEKIIKAKHQLGFTQYEMAQRLGISFSKFLDMESCSLDISVEEYKRLDKKVQQLLVDNSQ